MSKKNYYEKFGLKENATEKDIKVAYRNLALKYHPDRNGGEERFSDIFKQINEIHETLSDTTKRKSYDYKLKIDREDELNRSNEKSTYTQQEYSTNKTTYAKESPRQQKYEFETPSKLKNFVNTIIGWGIMLFILILSANISEWFSNSSIKTDNYNENSRNNEQTDTILPTGEINFGTGNTVENYEKDTISNFIPNKEKKKKTSIEKKEAQATTGDIKF